MNLLQYARHKGDYLYETCCKYLTMLQNFMFSLMLSSLITSPIIFDFNIKSDIRKWLIVDDVVMGGRSSGNFRLNDAGHGVFEGEISLENNGGFSSVRYDCEKTLLEGKTKINIKLLGDGKQYQFRINSNNGDYYSYIIPFSTSGEWTLLFVEEDLICPIFRKIILRELHF
jgi:NADH dehydrogenase [ubiquinone] 1 alpha subcomplex assembly factor 1